MSMLMVSTVNEVVSTVLAVFQFSTPCLHLQTLAYRRITHTSKTLQSQTILGRRGGITTGLFQDLQAAFHRTIW